MKYIFFLLVVLTTKTSFSQKCDEVTDPITNEKKVQFHYSKPDWETDITYELKQDHAQLLFVVFYKGANNNKLAEGSELFFKLENNEVVKIKLNRESVNDVNASGYGTYTKVTFSLNLTKEELKQLASSPVNLVRIPKLSGNGYDDYDRSYLWLKKGKNGFQNGASCMLEHM